MEKIKQLILEENYQEAGDAFFEYVEEHGLDEQLSIYGATIALRLGQPELAYLYIREGLKLNPGNYELYVCLGDYYLNDNVNQAYLCYENAFFHCEKQLGKDSEDAVAIYGLMEELKPSVTVVPASIVILSWNTLEMTKACVESIKNTCYRDAYELVLIDNASQDGSADYIKGLSGECVIALNDENKGFAGGCNQGISIASKENDIFLLNSDTEMMPNALFLMRLGLYENDKIGAVGAMSNYVSNFQMVEEPILTPQKAYDYSLGFNLPDLHAKEQKDYLVGFAELVRRKTMDTIGGLDDEYKLGNYEDNDLGIRVLKAGYQNVLLHNVFIFHWGSESFHKNKVDMMETMVKNSELFRQKWGISPTYYGMMRMELMDFFPENKETPLEILEFGCGAGGTLCHLDYLYPNANVHGLEIVEEAAHMGALKCDIRVCDVEKDPIPYEEHSMDYIILADVVEHLRDTDGFMEKVKSFLKPGGKIVVSLPNLMNARVIYNLLHGVFQYEDAGILDRTHLKFFTLQQIFELMAKHGFQIDNLRNMILESDSTKSPQLQGFFDELTAIEGVASREQFDVYQYVFCAALKS